MTTFIYTKLKIYNNRIIIATLLSLSFLIGCSKDYLDAKPEKALVVPSTIADYQAILDNTLATGLGTIAFNGNQVGLSEISSDNFYITEENWNSRTPIERNTYTWASDIYQGLTSLSDWNYSYQRILFTNIVLEGIQTIKPQAGPDQISWNQVLGSALFYRAYSHYEISQLFCQPYNNSTSTTTPGIPLKLESNINTPITRSSVQETYDQIITDLKKAKEVLPVLTPDALIYKTRPTKAAALGMLARVYLSMNEYDSAYYYANATLALYNTLMDYNNSPFVNLNASASSFSITRLNPEAIFHTSMITYSVFNTSILIVDSSLFNQYSIDDLRRKVFFGTVAGNITFRGSYEQRVNPFSGIATDEIILIRSECNARKGNMTSAMTDLNTLLMKRWKNSVPYPALVANNIDEALNLILSERRKELCFRGLRWSDLRRLNQDPKFKITLKRKFTGKTYELLPNDLRYTLQIPPDVIKLSNIEQNPR